MLIDDLPLEEAKRRGNGVRDRIIGLLIEEQCGCKMGIAILAEAMLAILLRVDRDDAARWFTLLIQGIEHELSRYNQA